MNIALPPVAPSRNPLAWIREWVSSPPRNRAIRLGAVTEVRHLQQGVVWILPAPAGARLECLHGTVWITHDGDCKDLVLEAGETYRVDRCARMIVYALKPAQLRVQTA